LKIILVKLNVIKENRGKLIKLIRECPVGLKVINTGFLDQPKFYLELSLNWIHPAFGANMT